MFTQLFKKGLQRQPIITTKLLKNNSTIENRLFNLRPAYYQPLTASYRSSSRYKQKSKDSNISDSNVVDRFPDLPPNNAGDPDLPPRPQKTNDVLLFPWIYGNQPQRIDNELFHVTPFFRNLPIFPKSWYAFFTKKLTRILLNVYAQDASYFSGEFLMGAQLSYEKLCQSITDNDKESLKSMMDKDLYERYSSALDLLHKDKGKVFISVTNAYNTEISQVYLTLGPEEGHDLNNEKYFNTFFYTLRICVSEGVLFGKEKTNKDDVLAELKKGAKFQVHVDVDAETKFELADNTTILVDDLTRRKHRLVFESPTFTFNKVHDVAPVEWNWKLKDIDNLLESENRVAFLQWFDQYNDYSKRFKKYNDEE